MLGVWPLHGLCGAWGGIAAGIFGQKALGGLGGVAFMPQLIMTAMAWGCVSTRKRNTKVPTSASTELRRRRSRNRTGNAALRNKVRLTERSVGVREGRSGFAILPAGIPRWPVARFDETPRDNRGTS